MSTRRLQSSKGANLPPCGSLKKSDPFLSGSGEGLRAQRKPSRLRRQMQPQSGAEFNIFWEYPAQIKDPQFQCWTTFSGGNYISAFHSRHSVRSAAHSRSLNQDPQWGLHNKPIAQVVAWLIRWGTHCLTHVLQRARLTNREKGKAKHSAGRRWTASWFIFRINHLHHTTGRLFTIQTAK